MLHVHVLIGYPFLGGFFSLCKCPNVLVLCVSTGLFQTVQVPKITGISYIPVTYMFIHVYIITISFVIFLPNYYQMYIIQCHVHIKEVYMYIRYFFNMRFEMFVNSELLKSVQCI